MTTIITVSDTASFNNAIVQADAALAPVEIDLAADITLTGALPTINIGPAITLTINGNGHTLSGNGIYRGLVVYAGSVTIENLEISHCFAKGGNGGSAGTSGDGGGGGAGFGGGLLVADDVADGASSAGNVTLVNVGFDNDRAIGGNGGVGGELPIDGNPLPLAPGGGMAGDGSSWPLNVGGQGLGPNGYGQGQTAQADRVAGFGGGGGAVINPGGGGTGGYGGGGAAFNDGGFGGGIGADGGGGGLGAGGDIFVQGGANLVIRGGTMADGSVAGGHGFDGTSGQAYGSGIFISSFDYLHLGTGSTAGQVTTINGVIADETGSSGQLGGQATVWIEGAGTVVLGATNLYTAFTELNNQNTTGTLDVGTVGAAGNRIDFDGPATLRIENVALTNRTFATPIRSFGYADVIDIPGLPFVAGASALYSSGQLSVTSNGVTVRMPIIAVLDSFSAESDGAGGTKVVEALNAAVPAGTSAAMVMRNISTGQFEIYDIGHNAILGAATLGYTSGPQQFVGLGAFNGTDTADMIVRDSTSGAFEIYDVNNNNFTAAFALGAVGPEWAFAGFGHFSGNGAETDMLLRNSNTGAFEIYDISNSQLTSAAPMGAVGLEWSVVGFGDFSTRPGETDMLMRNKNTGAFEIYDIRNNQLTSAAPMGAVGLEWSVAGFGDFSGNPNEADMLMRNTNTGVFEIYDISNSQLTSAASIGAVGLEWSVAGFGAISGAGTSDLLMRNVNTGAFEVYDIANNRLTTAASMGQVGTSWSVAGIAADPPGGAPAQLAQAMASFAPPDGALDTSAPHSDAAMPAATPLLVAPNGQNHV